MNRVIWKYVVPIQDRVILQMPKGAQLLAFQTQESKPCLWALVDPTAKLVEHHFRVVGTGNPTEFDNSNIYIGTVQVLGGRFVWHLFLTGIE